jgi:hypothetical protein
VNEILTPGGMATVKGSRIRIEGDKPGVGLYLTNQDTQEAVQVPASSIGMNDPSKVMFVIPSVLVAGNYLMSITTQVGSTTARMLNEPRTISFNQILTVG